MENMRFKVGDRVRIKSLDWYNENKDEYGYVRCIDFLFTPEHSKYCGYEFTISHITEFPTPSYVMESNGHDWTDEMIEGLVEEETHRGYYTTEVETTNESKKVAWFTFWDNDFADKVELDLSNRELIQEDGKWFVVKKKKEYPKTYEECCKVLGVNSDNFISIRNLYRDDGDEELTDYEGDLLNKFDSLWELYICRDAYWQIAGEELGLEGPWEPDHRGDFEHGTPIKYVIYNIGTHIVKERKSSPNHTLSFPTEEMRDAFYENFKEEIEICKEFL